MIFKIMARKKLAGGNFVSLGEFFELQGQSVRVIYMYFYFLLLDENRCFLRRWPRLDVYEESEQV